MDSSAQSLAECLIPNSLFLVRRAIGLTATQDIKLILWLDSPTCDVFCIFRSDLGIPTEVTDQLNTGTLTLPCIYRGRNTRGEHVFDIMNTVTSTPIRVYMLAVNWIHHVSGPLEIRPRLSGLINIKRFSEVIILLFDRQQTTGCGFLFTSLSIVVMAGTLFIHTTLQYIAHDRRMNES